MKALIFRFLPFPGPGAASNRYLTYVKGFLENGCDVSVISCRPKPRKQTDRVLMRQVDWHYAPSFFSERNKILFWLSKYFGLLWGLYTLCLLLYREKIDFVLVGDNRQTLEFIVLAISSAFGIKTLKEESEHPTVYEMNRNVLARAAISKVHEKKILRHYSYYDGLLLMTNELKRYFLTQGFSQDKMLVVPQTVDISRFICKQGDKKSKPAILTYIGSFSEKKDGVLSLVKAVKTVRNTHPDVRLQIMGFGTAIETSTICQLVEELDLVSCVEIGVNLPPEAIPALLLSSDLLLSCRPESTQARYGFPTKIAEYMATGIPMVTTAYGDLKDLLIDGENAFVAESSDSDIFASKVLIALDNYGFAKELAIKAKLLAGESFNHKKQTKSILDFVEGLYCK